MTDLYREQLKRACADTIITAAVTQYADAAVADRPAIAEGGRGCHLRSAVGAR